MLLRIHEPYLRGNTFERHARSISRHLIGKTATLDYDQFLAKRPPKLTPCVSLGAC